VVAALLAAALSAVCYGVASALQALAARRTPSSETVDPRLLMRVGLQAPFLAGLGFDAVGFATQFFALHSLPVFVVQGAVSASLAVTAVAAIPLLKMRPTAGQWWAIACSCTGVALLGISAGAENSRTTPLTFRFGLLAAVALLVLIGIVAHRLPDPAGATVMGAVSGFCFGIIALAARAITDLHILALLRDPATYTLIAGGLAAFQFFTIALQRATVTAVSAAVVVGETVLPAVVGVLALGDRTHPGLLPVAAAGFALAVAGALVLARYGEVPSSP
jgi:drug/metabolite transporter (DMT)-like permease